MIFGGSIFDGEPAVTSFMHKFRAAVKAIPGFLGQKSMEFSYLAASVTNRGVVIVQAHVISACIQWSNVFAAFE